MSAQLHTEQKTGDELILRTHSPEVSQIITDLLSCGVVGIEIAQIVDFIDQPSILIQRFEKKELFEGLHKILFLIKRIEKRGIGKSEAEKINVLLKTILEYYIFPVHVELFKHTELKPHVDILQETILEMRLRNKSISRLQSRKLEVQLNRGKKKR